MSISNNNDLTRLKWSPTNAERYAGVRIQRYDSQRQEWVSVAEYYGAEDPGYYEMEESKIYRVVSLWFSTDTGDTVTIEDKFAKTFLEVIEPGVFKHKQRELDIKDRKGHLIIDDYVIAGYHPIDLEMAHSHISNLQVFTVTLKKINDGTAPMVLAGNKLTTQKVWHEATTGIPRIFTSGTAISAVGGNMLTTNSSTIERIEGISLDTINLGY